jgi:hypothetical protein
MRFEDHGEEIMIVVQSDTERYRVRRFFRECEPVKPRFQSSPIPRIHFELVLSCRSVDNFHEFVSALEGKPINTREGNFLGPRGHLHSSGLKPSGIAGLVRR